MRLNLGCGRAQFPTQKDNQYTAHLQYLPFTALDPDERWINIDRVGIDGVDEVVDLFTYPWIRSKNGNPWNNSVCDEMWASHMVEHIPHDARFAQVATTMHRSQGSLDGWYAWFYEAWRILKPGGLLHIVAPMAFSTGAMMDPSHTRYILPQSFGYMVPNPDAPFDYQIAARFEQFDQITVRASQHWASVAKENNMTQQQIEWAGHVNNNVFDELYICLRAIKDE